MLDLFSDGEPSAVWTTDLNGDSEEIFTLDLGSLCVAVAQPGAAAVSSGVGTGALVWQAGAVLGVIHAQAHVWQRRDWQPLGRGKMTARRSSDCGQLELCESPVVGCAGQGLCLWPPRPHTRCLAAWTVLACEIKADEKG